MILYYPNVASGFTSESIEFGTDYSVRSSDIPIDDTNIGNKLLKSMGWQEGAGIGKNNQGMKFFTNGNQVSREGIWKS